MNNITAHLWYITYSSNSLGFQKSQHEAQRIFNGLKFKYIDMVGNQREGESESHSNHLCCWGHAKHGMNRRQVQVKQKQIYRKEDWKIRVKK